MEDGGDAEGTSGLVWDADAIAIGDGVTDEMAAAGVAELMRADRRAMDDESIVVSVYVAMERAREASQKVAEAAAMCQPASVQFGCSAGDPISI
jgi:hypothetical protein